MLLLLLVEADFRSQIDWRVVHKCVVHMRGQAADDVLSVLQEFVQAALEKLLANKPTPAAELKIKEYK